MGQADFATSSPPPLPRGSGAVDPTDTAARVRLARELGGFLREAVGGTNRGTSGRDRLRLQSRLYIVLAGFDGRPLESASVCASFAACKALRFRGDSCGHSVFLGFASKWEAREALIAGGFAVPASLLDGRSSQ